MAQAEGILSSLRDELREVEARAQQAELQTELAKEIADLRLSAPVLQAQRQAEGVIERARQHAAAQVDRAEATLVATRAQCRQFVRHVQDVVAPASNAENGEVGDEGSEARRRLLARLQELLDDLSEDENTGEQQRHVNEAAAEFDQEQSVMEVVQPPPPPLEEPTASSRVAAPIDVPEQTEQNNVESPLQTETSPVVPRSEPPRPAQARARIVQPQRTDPPPSAPDPAWRRKWWARRRGNGSHDSDLS